MRATRLRSTYPALLLVLLGCGNPLVGEPAGESAPLPPSSGSAALPSGALAPDAPDAITRELVELIGPRHGAWLAASSARPLGRASAAASDDVAPQLASGSPAAASPSNPPAVEIALPEHAQGAFQLRDRRTRLGVGVSLAGARAVTRRELGALSVYGAAAGEGATLLLRESDHGVEDFIAFDAPPAAPEVSYQVALEPGVAGLRLVEQTLEFLDASGTPRLRVAPPYLIGADGRLARAELSVAGCAVDANPAPPWGRAPIAPGASTCTLRVAWHGADVEYPAVLDPVWSLTGSLGQPRESFASSLLADGRVLVAGGVVNASGDPCASAELFDPSSETWAAVGSLSTARSELTLSALGPAGSERVLAAGGLTASGATSSVESFDPATGSWSPGPSLPAPYTGHAALLLGDGSLLVAGGTASIGTASLGAARLDAGSSSWRAAGELLGEEPGSTLSPLADGGALLIGPNPPTVQRYFADENQWSFAGELRLARAGHTATRLSDGKLLVVGGNGSQSVELYDPSLEVSSFVGATAEPRTGHTATLLADGRVAVVGGVGVSGGSGTEIYDPAWGTWTSGPGSLQGRAAHQAVLLGDGSVLVAGGVLPDTGVLSSAQRLDASRPRTLISEYKLPARLDPSVTGATVTELWAALVRPEVLEEGRRYPLLVFLHGNHGTCGSGENPRSDFDCTYTQQGFCPEGMVVAPSHRGYDYVATELAARGYIVVSVNANRGITCGGGEEGDFGFNLARGKLLLRHLQLLSEWDRGVSEPPEGIGADLVGKLDFSQLGMMGHSRGGEGVRAAFEQYRDPGSPWPARIGQAVTFRGLFEIGPVDGQTSRVLNADSTAWAVLLPMCDGDVSDLQGVKPFDRMLELVSEQRETPKATYVAWGTNHNFFNTEWQTSDSPGCTDHRALFEDSSSVSGSAEQRQVGLRSMLAFFLGNVGAQRNPSQNRQFDPTQPLLSDTRIDRGFTPSLRPNRGITLEDFSGPSGQSTRGQPMLVQNLEIAHTSVPEHDGQLQAARLAWQGGAEPDTANERLLQVPFSAQTGGVDLSNYTHIEFRSGRERGDNLLEPTPLFVQLLNADGSLSEALDTAAYGLRLDGPVGGPFNTHVVLQSTRIPLSAFRNATRSAVRGVRFSFPGASGAELFLASVRASLGSGSLSPVQATARPGAAAASPATPIDGVAVPAGTGSQVVPGERPPLVRQLSVAGNTVIALRRTENQRIELELATELAFRAQNDQLVLQIGDVRSIQSRHPNGLLTRVVFTLDVQALANVRNRDDIRVSYRSNDNRQWDFGPFDLSLLEP